MEIQGHWVVVMPVRPATDHSWMKENDNSKKNSDERFIGPLSHHSVLCLNGVLQRSKANEAIYLICIEKFFDIKMHKRQDESWPCLNSSVLMYILSNLIICLISYSNAGHNTRPQRRPATPLFIWGLPNDIRLQNMYNVWFYWRRPWSWSDCGVHVELEKDTSLEFTVET